MKKKILVVDDEPGILNLLKITLSSAGYDVITANNGQSGLKLAADHKPDVIILDIMMPDMDGATMARSLRDSVANATTPIVFLTGLMQKSQQNQSSGGDYVLAKPFQEDELLQLMRKILN